jgi:hypothetical protein
LIMLCTAEHALEVWFILIIVALLHSGGYG